MSKLSTQIVHLHKPLDKALFRALSITLALGHTALFMWSPEAYSVAIGGFNSVVGPLFIWAICSGVVFGVGFTPIFVGWKILFSPYFSLSILTYLTIAYLFV